MSQQCCSGQNATCARLSVSRCTWATALRGLNCPARASQPISLTGLHCRVSNATVMTKGSVEQGCAVYLRLGLCAQSANQLSCRHGASGGSACPARQQRCCLSDIFAYNDSMPAPSRRTRVGHRLRLRRSCRRAARGGSASPYPLSQVPAFLWWPTMPRRGVPDTAATSTSAWHDRSLHSHGSNLRCAKRPCDFPPLSELQR